MTAPVQLEPGRLDPDDTAAFATLIELALDPMTTRSLGDQAPSVMGRWYRSPDTILSHSGAWFARSDGDPVGLAIFFPAAEYRRRRDHASRIEGELLDRGGRRRLRLERGWRRIRGTELGPVSGGDLYLATLAVLPAHRRSGVATALIRQVARTAETGNVRGISLDVDARNQGARALYERLGFEVAFQRGRLLKLHKRVLPP